MHSECLTGDVFGSRALRLRPAARRGAGPVVARGRGVVIYLRGHEGRGIGLLAKLQAYRLQDDGRDTVDANLDLGLPADARDYGAATQILRDLGVASVRLLTNNPDKAEGLEGVRRAGRPSESRCPAAQRRTTCSYLQTKRDRMGHQLPDRGRARATSVSPRGRRPTR